jgi:hypothetical protein
MYNMLRVTNSWSESTDSPECSICYDEYEPSFDNVTILMNCYHKFHTNPCLKTYIKKKQIALKQAREPTDKIECPFCKTQFSVKKLTYNNFKSANIWPFHPNAPIPILPKAPKTLDDILIFKNILGANGNSPSIQYYSTNQEADMYGKGGDYYRYFDPNYYYSYYKENLGPRCPLPHFLPHIEIPQLTDPLEFIEMQYKTAIRNNNIAINDYSNATEYSTDFFEKFLQSKGITMSDIDIAYNREILVMTNTRLVETERVKTTIKQILDNAKTLLGQFKSALQSIRKSVSKSISKSISKRTKTIEKSVRKTLRRLKGRTMSMAEIEGGKKTKSKKYKKHKNYKKHNKSRKPRKK